MDFQTILGVTCGFGSIFVAAFVVRHVSRVTKLDAIPTVGSSTWLGSWWAGLTFVRNAQNVVQEGYDKFKSAPFKVAENFHWRVIISHRTHLEELAKASDDEFSSFQALESLFQINHTLKPQSSHIPRYIPVVSACVSRNVDVMYPEIRDEITTSFPAVLDLTQNEWKSVPALNIVENVVCRTSSRAFVGLPLCRDPDWVNFTRKCTDDLFKWGCIAGNLPTFMRSLVVRYCSKLSQNITHCARLLGPIIEGRREYVHTSRTDWSDKPNDLLLWLMDDAHDFDELAAERLVIPLLLSNVATLHTVSHSFTQALLYLAANPQYVQPLREEVADIIEKHGWSKAVLGKMQKVDSFLRECQRIQGINTATLMRTALKDFTFSDGTFIPKGTLIAAACRSIHFDEELYESPHEFRPFRFVADGNKDSGGANLRFVTTTLEYLSFGHGRHACPGRFLAECMMKMMLVHVVMTYDVKLEDGATIPPGLQFGLVTAANPHAKVMFRKRVD